MCSRTQVDDVVAERGGHPGRLGNEGQASGGGGSSSPQGPRLAFQLCRHGNGTLLAQPKSKTYINQDQNENMLIYSRSYAGLQSWGLSSAENKLVPLKRINYTSEDWSAWAQNAMVQRGSQGERLRVKPLE